jgi:hypothetical protein
MTDVKDVPDILLLKPLRRCHISMTEDARLQVGTL